MDLDRPRIARHHRPRTSPPTSSSGGIHSTAAAAAAAAVLNQRQLPVPRGPCLPVRTVALFVGSKYKQSPPPPPSAHCRRRCRRRPPPPPPPPSPFRPRVNTPGCCVIRFHPVPSILSHPQGTRPGCKNCWRDCTAWHARIHIRGKPNRGENQPSNPRVRCKCGACSSKFAKSSLYFLIAIF